MTSPSFVMVIQDYHLYLIIQYKLKSLFCQVFLQGISMHQVKIIPPKGKLEGAKPLFQKLSPSPLKERGIQGVRCKITSFIIS